MTVIILVVITVILTSLSIVKSPQKSSQAVGIAKNMFLNTFAEVLGVMAIVGLLLALFPPTLIKEILGGENKIVSTIYAALVGTLTIMPAFIAFPLSKSLYISGAHLVAIAAFLTTLTMVGFATIPIEIRHFGKKFTIVRNLISFLMALVIALGIGVIL